MGLCELRGSQTVEVWIVGREVASEAMARRSMVNKSRLLFWELWA